MLGLQGDFAMLFEGPSNTFQFCLGKVERVIAIHGRRKVEWRRPFDVRVQPEKVEVQVIANWYKEQQPQIYTLTEVDFTPYAAKHIIMPLQLELQSPPTLGDDGAIVGAAEFKLHDTDLGALQKYVSDSEATLRGTVPLQRPNRTAREAPGGRSVVGEVEGRAQRCLGKSRSGRLTTSVQIG